jgi:uncharacterized YigZ family protein
MLFEDTYKTITKPSDGLFKDRGSKFTAKAFPVLSEEDVKQHLANLRKEYYDARHHCYAYQIGFDKSSYRINDDGEPSGTAGRPIFGQLQSFDLTNILVVVIRYFGGTKLGVSGLINAYKTATKEALETAKIVTKTVNEVYELHFLYSDMNAVMKIIKEHNLLPFDQEFETECKLKFSVRKKNTNIIYEKFSHLRKLNINYLKTE